MTTQPETVQQPGSSLDFPTLKVKLFWVKLVSGAAFGALSYFIFRFYVHVTFFLVIPLSYLVTYGMILLYLIVRSGMKKPDDPRPMLTFPLNFSSTWFMAFFVFGITCYYFGW